MSAPMTDASVPTPGGHRLGAALSLIAGMVDVISWMTLAGLFTAHITGNLVVMMADFVADRPIHTASVAAVPLFVLVTGGLGWIVQKRAMAAQPRMKLLLALQTMLLVAATLVAVLLRPSTDPSGTAALAVAMLAIAAMASQNALLHLTLARAPTTAVMTGNVVAATLALVSSFGPADQRQEALAQWRSTAAIVVGFCVGCLAGAVMVRIAGDLAWIAPVAASSIVWAVAPTAADQRL